MDAFLEGMGKRFKFEGQDQRFSMKMMFAPAFGTQAQPGWPGQYSAVGFHSGKIGLDILGVNDPLNASVR